MRFRALFQALVFVVAGWAALGASANYVGTLRLPGASPMAPTGFYTFAASAPTGSAPSLTGNGAYRLKLGYKYSRYLAVESEYIDFGSAAGSIFAQPTSLASGFRSTGFAVDTIATLPVWRQFSFYGRLGAYSGSRNVFSSSPVSLLGDTPRTRVRYGLGMRYDFTKAFGIRAELERYSPFGTPFAGEPESESISVGLSWRF
jgi:OmpA-OmpF porin, OOP family